MTHDGAREEDDPALEAASDGEEEIVEQTTGT